MTNSLLQLQLGVAINGLMSQKMIGKKNKLFQPQMNHRLFHAKIDCCCKYMLSLRIIIIIII